MDGVERAVRRDPVADEDEGAGPLAQQLRDPVFLRDAIVLGTAASMTAATVPQLLPPRTPPAAAAVLGRIVRLEEIAVETDDALELEYGIRIPVVTIDGEEAFELTVDRAALARALSP